jgi:hypothetical protein
MTQVLFNKTGRSVKVRQDVIRNDINLFLKEMYYNLELDYPKFFKMDNLCKLGIIGTELLCRKNEDLFSRKNSVGIILQNKSSSLYYDIKHQEGIEDNTVSPAIFVYTLPNIVIGEISIKHKWKSEGVFFIDENIDIKLLSQYSNILLKQERTDLNLIGWIDVIKNQYSLKLCIVDTEIKAEELKILLQ